MSLPVHCVDLETHRFQDGLAAPKMVCMSWSDGTNNALMVPWEGEDPYDYFEKLVRSRAVLLINQHIFFDLGVLCAARPHLVPLVFEALEAGRIRCVKVREQLIRIALGQAKFVIEQDDDDDEDDDDETESSGFKRTKTRFDLAAIAKRWLGIFLQKEDTWRKSYAFLDGVPLANWPLSAIEYPLKDARVPLQVWAKQEEFIKERFGGVLPGEVEANCAAWALHLMKCWGVRTCPEAVAALTYELAQRVLWLKIGLLMMGIMRVGGTKAERKAVTTKAEIQQRVIDAFTKQGLQVPFTAPTKMFPNGQVKTSKKVLEDSGDEKLAELAEYQGFAKILSTYIPRYVALGIKVPICADWNVLVESFRISCAKPNLTNPPRAGNVRNCFIARPGTVYVSADFDQAELRSWAQVCLKMFGFSTLAQAFKENIDPHLKLGAQLLGISLEEATRRYADGDKEMEDSRQFSKEPNFGLIGGMGARKFAERAALKKIKLTLEEAIRIRWAWMNTWAEARPYLDYFAQNYDKPGTIVHPITGFIRGDCGYADGANHMFQHLTAIGAKQALWDLSKECYTDWSSPIFGARPVIHMHDEIFGEIVEQNGHVGAMRWGAVMKASMEKWVKDVPIKCTPVLTRRLYKGAKQVFVDGILVPSKPVKADGKTKWVADLPEIDTRTALAMVV